MSSDNKRRRRAWWRAPEAKGSEPAPEIVELPKAQPADRYRNQFRIRRPAEKVWDVLTRVERFPAVFSPTTSVKVLTAQPFGVGYRWIETYEIKGMIGGKIKTVTHVADSVVVDHQPGRRYLTKSTVTLDGYDDVSASLELDSTTFYEDRIVTPIGAKKCQFAISQWRADHDGTREGSHRLQDRWSGDCLDLLMRQFVREIRAAA